MKAKLITILLLLPTSSFAYDLKNLSAQDVLIIGQGLDELPRRITDTNQLYARIQAQLSDQDAAIAKANEDAMKKKYAPPPKAVDENPH